MSDVPMPVDLSEEAVAEWLLATSLPPGGEYANPAGARRGAVNVARAVRALVEREVAKSRAALALAGAAPDAASRPAPRIPADAGDAGAMREACVMACERVENDLIDTGLKDGTVRRDPHGGYDASPAMIAVEDCVDAIRALPLPAAPATAVEEAREKFTERAETFASAYKAYADTVKGSTESMWANKEQHARLIDLLIAHDALLAAEADAKGGA